MILGLVLLPLDNADPLRGLFYGDVSVDAIRLDHDAATDRPFSQSAPFDGDGKGNDVDMDMSLQ